jgi:hypothetical protein
LRDEDLSIHLSDRPQLDGILALAEWAELTPGPTLRLTHASLTRALERGGSSRDLLASLTRYADPPPTPSQRQAFQTQLQQIDIVTLRPALLLQTASPAQMAELWQSRSLRSHLGRQLSPELATVETPAPQDLVQALRRKGFAVRTPVLPVLAVRPGGGAEAPLPAQPVAAAPLSSGEAYWLAAIFLVHSHLARRLGLTAVPPAAILETLAANLEPGQLAAAHTAADQALAHLDRALDGPGPFTPVLSQEEILARLEAAIQAGQTLHLRYASAARGEITEREITPRHVEWRGDRLNLVAHCHLRGAERTFRLDRILDVTPLCLSDTGQAQGGQGEG